MGEKPAALTLRESLGTSGIPPAIAGLTLSPPVGDQTAQTAPGQEAPSMRTRQSLPSPARRNRALCERRKPQRRGKGNDERINKCKIHQPLSVDTDVNT